MIHSKIISYKSSHDSEIAELFNKLVMLLFYNEKYLNKQKWDFYFDGYRNQSITEQEKHSLLEATVNDMCDLLGLKHIKITQYTYYIDNVTKQYYEKVAYNPSLRKFYIEEIIGRKWSHDEDVARTIVFHLIANCMLDYNDINNKYLKMLNIDNAKINEYKSNKLTHYKDIEQVALALGYYYKIHTGEVTL